MDKEFTLKLQQWLNTPAAQRDYELGATYLLQLTNNKVMYNNISRNVKAHAAFIEFKLKRYAQFRLQDLTHEEVNDMQKQVNKIVRQHYLNVEPKPAQTEAELFRAGKRADHDSLPAEIQSLYIENASLMQKMRELHLQLRHLSTQSSTCPDSDRYPFLKELIELDKRYHKNWLQYDQYKVEKIQEGEEQVPVQEGEQQDSPEVNPENQEIQENLVDDEAARLEQKNIQRKLNLAKGRFKKSPSDKQKESILALYKQLTAPSEELTAELKELGIV